MKRFISILLLFCILCVCLFGFTACRYNVKIVFADAGWDSIRIHNAIAGTIIKIVYGLDWTECPASTQISHLGVSLGNIDIHMEEWTNNINNYYQDLEEGKFKELGVNYNDNYQGFYVPRYVIEGDESRGIEPVAPDLKYVWDLKKYPHLFPDINDDKKGAIYGAIAGWEIDEIMKAKFDYYKLDEEFNYVRPGSDAALTMSLTSAYEKGEPVVGYYWEPTWLLGKYDFVLLEDKPYKEETWKKGETALPPVRVTIGTSNRFYEKHPQIVKFLSRYETSSALTSEALAHMQDTGDDYVETAIWFLKKYDNLIDEWLDEADAQKFKDFLYTE